MDRTADPMMLPVMDGGAMRIKWTKPILARSRPSRERAKSGNARPLTPTTYRAAERENFEVSVPVIAGTPRRGSRYGPHRIRASRSTRRLSDRHGALMLKHSLLSNHPVLAAPSVTLAGVRATHRETPSGSEQICC
jgi:hypothetical protein